PRVDLLTVGGAKVRYEDAISRALKTKINGIKIPYVDLETLIQTKRTDRFQDKADIERLQQMIRSSKKK
ncbi:MAG TPA: hypothetical protein DF383_10110, partial [Deltaproteobacteria bacterium]|nr:hypothetical protein [Deltaproteobacteria bacterium]